MESHTYEQVAAKYQVSRAAISRLKKQKQEIENQNFPSLSAFRKKKYDPLDKVSEEKELGSMVQELGIENNDLIISEDQVLMTND